MSQFNEQQFENLFYKHYKGMVFFALLYVKDVETARGIVQDVYIELWEKRSDIDASKNIKSYLSTCIKNKCLNYLRDNNKFNRDMLEFEGLLTENEPAPDSLLQADELNARIDKLINDLPERCRKIFILSRFEGLKYKEIANDLNISVKTVEAQISKALKYIRDNLKDYLIALILCAVILGLPYLDHEEAELKKPDKKVKEKIRVITSSGVLFKD